MSTKPSYPCHKKNTKSTLCILMKEKLQLCVNKREKKQHSRECVGKVQINEIKVK